MFFIALIAMPHTGPSKNEPSSAHRSETSILIKDGMRAGIEKSTNISKKATALSTAASTKERTGKRLADADCFMRGLLCNLNFEKRAREKTKSPDTIRIGTNRGAKRRPFRFFHPDF